MCLIISDRPPPYSVPVTIVAKITVLSTLGGLTLYTALLLERGQRWTPATDKPGPNSKDIIHFTKDLILIFSWIEDIILQRVKERPIRDR